MSNKTDKRSNKKMNKSNRGTEMILRKIVLMLTLSTTLGGCSLWPYKKQFDCPMTDGPKCKSLYEISEMADKGMFGPHAKKSEVEDATKYRRGRKLTKNRGYCNAC